MFFGLIFYTLVLGIAFLNFYFRSRDVIGNFFLFLGASISFVLVFPSILYYLVTGSTEFFKFYSLDDIRLGLYAILVFLTFWFLGFLFSKKIKWKTSNTYHYSEEYVTLIIFVLSLVSTVIFYSFSYAYGFANELYMNNPTQAGLFGVMGGYRSLLEPVIAALLIFYYRRKKNNRLKGFYDLKYFPHTLWVVLITNIFAGIILDMQRGDIFKPVLLVIFVLLFKGTRKRKIMQYAVGVFVLIITLSPVIDFLRKPNLYKNNFSIQNLPEILSSQEARRYFGQNVGNENIFDLNIESLIKEPARKNAFLLTTVSLMNHADREGHVLFSTYPSIFYEPIPRIVYPNKPIPLSVDGTKETTSIRIAAREAGWSNVWWGSGAGSMYWQFNWPGVMLGGFIVGFLWYLLVFKAFNTKHILLTILIFNIIKWGLPLFRGLDNLLLELIRGVKLLGVYYIISIFIKK